jgi:hypothetical protein
MATRQEQADAAKLYALLYRGDNIYSKPGDTLQRFVGVVSELKQYLKANNNGK